MMSTEESKAMVHKVTEAFTRGDFKTFLDCFIDDVEFWVAGQMGEFSGNHNKEFLRTLEERVPVMYPNGFRFTATAMTAEGNRVAFEAESYAEHANGNTLENKYHILIVVKDGKIHEWREYMDTKHFIDTVLIDQD